MSFIDVYNNQLIIYYNQLIISSLIALAVFAPVPAIAHLAALVLSAPATVLALAQAVFEY
jgi:hypothetical protein